MIRICGISSVVREHPDLRTKTRSCHGKLRGINISNFWPVREGGKGSE